jgi:hypothetical protein
MTSLAISPSCNRWQCLLLCLYHYELNAILVKAIANVDNHSIYEAYKEVLESLEAKGYKPKMNVMDNQTTKFIKKFLTKKECNLQVVEPHNHHVNTAERAIQTFKDAFIAAMATTNLDFPLQLWDKLTLQVQDTLNLLQESRIRQYWRMKRSMGLTIGIGTPSPLQVARLSYMKPQMCKDSEHLKEWMPGIWGLQLTTIGAIYTMSQSCVRTTFRDQLNYSHNTAKFQI